MIQESPRNEFRQIVDKLDGTYYPEPMNFDESVPDEAFADAQRGFIEGTALTDAITSEPTGRKVWDMASYSFIEGPCPATVHKNLWRMEKLNNYNGIFQVLPYVADGEKGSAGGQIYQARSYDLATMSFVKSKNGWIIIDPLTGSTTAIYAWQQFKEHIDADAELQAIIITHSHVDHYKLAYSFEAGTWRNIFLAGAFELRGYMQAPKKSKDELLASIHANLKGLSGEYILDYLSILIDGNKVIEAEKDGCNVTCNFDLSIGSYYARVNFCNGVLHYDEITKDEQDSPICFQTETDFADYVYFNLLGGVVNTSYAPLDKVLSFIEIQNNVWNIIEPIETNNKEIMTTRKINVCMPKDGYISWFVTTQNGFPTKVELSDSEGNVYFSSEKKNPQATSIDPPLAQGSGFIKGSNLTLTVEVNSNQRYELKGTPVLYDIKDEKGVITGKSFSMAFEDYIDSDYNDIYVNIVGWNNKG